MGSLFLKLGRLRQILEPEGSLRSRLPVSAHEGVCMLCKKPIDVTSITTLVFDLDGTLLQSDRSVSAGTLKALERVRQSGMNIILATGRSYEACAPFLRKLDITTPVVCYNGGAVFASDTGVVIKEFLLPDDISRVLIDISRNSGTHLHAFRKGLLYYERDNEEIRHYESHVGFLGHKVDFNTFETLDFTKAMFIGEPAIIDDLVKDFDKIFGNRMNHMYSLPRYHEMVAGGVGKESGLSVVADILGIAPDEMIAFGDGNNDLGMLTYARFGVAMGNASALMKEQADIIARSNDEDGVAEVIEELFLNS